MGLLQQILSPDIMQARAADDDFWYSSLPYGPTKTGIDIDESNAIRIATVWACVRVVSETIASLPRFVYERLGRGKRRAIKHPLYPLIHVQPNPEMSGVQFHETMLYHLLLWGNFYAEKELSKADDVKALWPWNPSKTRVERDKETNELVYILSLGTGAEKRLPREKILHVAGLSFNGITGLSCVGYEREAFALAMATQEFGSRFFGGFAMPGGALERPKELPELSPQGRKNLQDSWQEAYSGLSNAHKVVILEEGTTFKPITMPLEHAQFLETRKYQRSEICGIFRVPPHLIGDLDRATNNNIEHQSLEFVIHCIRPWLVRIEQAYLLQLFKPQERARFFAEHVVDGLLRGDFKSRMEGYAIGRNNGFLSPNDVCEKENWNPIAPEQGGDTYLIPSNMMPAERALKEPEPEPEQAPPDEAAVSARQMHEKWLADAAGRIIRREAIAVSKQAKKFLGIYALADFHKWLDEFYAEMPAYIELQLAPVLESYCEAMGLTNGHVEAAAAYRAEYSGRHIQESKREILAIVDASPWIECPRAIEAKMSEWSEARAKRIASEEIKRINVIVSPVITVEAVQEMQRLLK